MGTMNGNGSENKPGTSYATRFADVQPFDKYDLSFASAVAWLDERNTQKAPIFQGSSNHSVYSASKQILDHAQQSPDKIFHDWFADVRVLADHLEEYVSENFLAGRHGLSEPRAFITRPLQLINEYIRMLMEKGMYRPRPGKSVPRVRNTARVEKKETGNDEAVSSAVPGARPIVINLAGDRTFTYMHPLPKPFTLADLRRIHRVLESQCEDFDEAPANVPAAS